MIITVLKGGLGNQMFQYACGRALAIRNEDILKFDISGYENRNSDVVRDYSLSNFNIVEHIASPQEILPLKNPSGIISKFYRKIKIKLGYANIEFIPKILILKGDVLLNGYWQTEKYFLDQEKTIRQEFTLKKPLGKLAQDFANIINDFKKNYITVSVHVRRGDVARHAWKNPYYGITTPEYYKKALNTFSGNVTNRSLIRVIVFSDDIGWVKQNIKIPFPVTYIANSASAQPMTDYEELILMSMCDHNIIANSSFSWWGAWLNVNPNKIVIAPKQWIRKKQWQHKDICPSAWIRV